MIFWDTSALVKCYVALESNHERAQNLLMNREHQTGSTLLRPEATSALVRRLKGHRTVRDALLALLEEHLKHFDLLTLDDPQIERSLKLIRRYALRAADALHVSAALTLARDTGRGKIRFVTADEAQAAAARSEGLKVIELG